MTATLALATFLTVLGAGIYAGTLEAPGTYVTGLAVGAAVASLYRFTEWMEERHG
jgi:hypothetical protein